MTACKATSGWLAPSELTPTSCAMRCSKGPARAAAGPTDCGPAHHCLPPMTSAVAVLVFVLVFVLVIFAKQACHAHIRTTKRSGEG